MIIKVKDLTIEAMLRTMDVLGEETKKEAETIRRWEYKRDHENTTLTPGGWECLRSRYEGVRKEYVRLHRYLRTNHKKRLDQWEFDKLPWEKRQGVKNPHH